MSKRKRYESSYKVQLIRRHLLEQVPVSELCTEAGIKPTQFYQWQREFFEHGDLAFERKKGRQPNSTSKSTEKIQALENKLRKKDEVLSELMEEYVTLKKSLGET